MKIKERIEQLLEHYGSERIRLGNNYYRIRKQQEDQYQLTRYQPGSCATFYQNPQINANISDDQAWVTSLFDNGAIPVRSESYDFSQPSQEAFVELMTLLVEIENASLSETGNEVLPSAW